MNVHCFFLEENEKRIYCSQYIAESTIRRGHGILLCKPIWGERIRTSRIFHNLAIFLQDKGYDVFTCDYYGDGNSYGESHELTFDGMVGNIVALRKYISDNYNLNSISIIGLRVGANCAIESLKTNKNFKSMILVEPILNLVDYLKEVLRSNLSNQMTLHKKIIKTREVLIEDLKSGAYVNIDGFIIGKDFWNSFEQVGPLILGTEYTGPIMILSMNNNTKVNKRYQEIAREIKHGIIKIIPQEFIWNGWKFHEHNPKVFMSTISEFLSAKE